MADQSTTSRVVFRVPNISCMHCVKTVTKELKQLPAVVSVEANAERKEVAVEYRGEALPAIKAALAEIGYPAE